MTLNKQQKLVDDLTLRLTTCSLDEFHTVQQELFNQQKVLNQLKQNPYKCPKCRRPQPKKGLCDHCFELALEANRQQAEFLRNHTVVDGKIVKR